MLPTITAHDLSVDPNGTRYAFGEIVERSVIADVYVIDKIATDEGKTRYVGYVRADEVLADGWGRNDADNGRIWSATIYSHATLDACLVYLIAYRYKGPNTAQHVAPHFIAGLGTFADI